MSGTLRVKRSPAEIGLIANNIQVFSLLENCYNLFVFLFFLVGSPVPVEKVENPSEQQISKLHSEYKEKLTELFDKHRDTCGVPRDIELLIQ